jgi:hypothetical protein
MFARSKDILAVQDSVDSLEERARASNDHVVHSIEELQEVVEGMSDYIEDNEVNASELEKKLEALCKHLGVSIEFNGSHLSYDVTETDNNN